MEVFRLSREKFSSPLSGVGAAVKGARWNSVGIEMIYTAANRSLAMAEVAVHFSISTIPEDYVMITIYIPDNISMKKIDVAELPPNWNSFPIRNQLRFLEINSFLKTGIVFCKFLHRLPRAITICLLIQIIVNLIGLVSLISENFLLTRDFLNRE